MQTYDLSRVIDQAISDELAAWEENGGKSPVRSFDKRRTERPGRWHCINLSLADDFTSQVRVTAISGQSDTLGLPASTIGVESTAGFPPSGAVAIRLSDGNLTTVTYSGLGINQLLGCRGGSGTLRTGDRVIAIPAPEDKPETRGNSLLRWLPWLSLLFHALGQPTQASATPVLTAPAVSAPPPISPAPVFTGNEWPPPTDLVPPSTLPESEPYFPPEPVGDVAEIMPPPSFVPSIQEAIQNKQLADEYRAILDRLKDEPAADAPLPSEEEVRGYLDGEWLHVVSSNVEAIRYLRDEQALEVEFHGGHRHSAFYRYDQISEDEARSFAAAPSKGKWVWDRLRVRGKGNMYAWRKPYTFISGPSAYAPRWMRTAESRRLHGLIGPNGRINLATNGG